MILLSLIVPIRIGLLKYLFDASWEGIVVRIEDHKRWAPNYGAGKWWYELEMYCQKPDGRMINKTITCVSKNAAIQKNTINPQMSEQFMKDNLALATEDTSVNSQDITF